MKSHLISALKIIVPIAFGGFIIWAFYDAMCEEQREDMFDAFGSANYGWILFSLIFGFASHVSRAIRWKYLLQPVGIKYTFWKAYHALMTGYLVNLMFPRAGEATRAAIFSRQSGSSFDKVFGTIIAERAIDVFMLLLVGGIALLLQADSIELFQEQIKQFNENADGCGSSEILSWMARIVTWLIMAAVAGAIVMAVVSKGFRDKLVGFVKGIWEGGTAILKSKFKLHFIGHTLFIWAMYIVFFAVCFPALEATADIGVNGILAGFIAGTLGIVLVQGGIGVYPAFVGLILTTYIDSHYQLGIHPQGLALGWLIWTSQTAMMVVLGLVSMIWVGKAKKEQVK